MYTHVIGNSERQSGAEKLLFETGDIENKKNVEKAFILFSKNYFKNPLKT